MRSHGDGKPPPRRRTANPAVLAAFTSECTQSQSLRCFFNWYERMQPFPAAVRRKRALDRPHASHSDDTAVPAVRAAAHSRGPNDCASLVKEGRPLQTRPGQRQARPRGQAPEAKVSVDGPPPQSTPPNSSFLFRTRFFRPSTILPHTLYGHAALSVPSSHV
jgi:hypothetical protein